MSVGVMKDYNLKTKEFTRLAHAALRYFYYTDYAQLRHFTTRISVILRHAFFFFPLFSPDSSHLSYGGGVDVVERQISCIRYRLDVRFSLSVCVSGCCMLF
jgi:hypothetical protein